MINIPKRTLYPALILTITCAAGILICLRTRYMIQQATQKIESCLSNAVDMHREKVFSENRESLTYIYSPKQDSLATVDLGGRKIKLPAQSRSDIQNTLKMAQHTILHDKQAVNYILLDSLFQSELQNGRLPSETFIQTCYKQLDKTVIYPENGAKAAFTLKTNPVFFGTSKELSISGGVKIRFTAFLKWIFTDHMILFVLSSCTAGVAGLFLFPVSRYLPPPLSPAEAEQDTAPSYQYATIRLHIEDHAVYIGTERIDTGPRNFALLLMFLTSEGHFVSRNQIINAFWSAKIDCSDRLNTTVNRLRFCLKKADPNLHITTGADGYQLIRIDETECHADRATGRLAVS